MGGIPEAYDLLKKEYALHTAVRNPPKTFIPLSLNEIGSPTRYFNQMAAVLSDGSFGGKMVFVDEETGRLGGKIVVWDKKFNLLADCDAEAITAIRCGLMAALAIDKFYAQGRSFYRGLQIGFIGNGRINQATAKVLHEIWGCWSFRLRGSPDFPARNSDKFPGLTTIALDRSSLAECDVVISCTNNNDPLRLVGANEVGGPDLFIAQDSGFMLDHTFRDAYPSYTDNVAQLESALDHEFQLDPSPPTIAGDLNSTSFGAGGDKACVYLYGIALADVVAAKVLSSKIFHRRLSA